MTVEGPVLRGIPVDECSVLLASADVTSRVDRVDPLTRAGRSVRAGGPAEGVTDRRIVPGELPPPFEGSGPL